MEFMLATTYYSTSLVSFSFSAVLSLPPLHFLGSAALEMRISFPLGPGPLWWRPYSSRQMKAAGHASMAGAELRFKVTLIALHLVGIVMIIICC